MPNAYEAVTDRIIAQLEEGIIPWRQQWTAPSGTGVPRNRSTNKAYRGANFLTLLCSDFSSREWMTYKQAAEAGYQVRKGEKGTPIIFWSTYAKKGAGGAGDSSESIDTSDAGEAGPKMRGFLKTYYVFNVEQIDGIPGNLPFDAPPFNAIEDAARVVDGYKANGGPTLDHGGNRAFYRGSADHVQMPHPETFVCPEAYYATLFHELAHSTGHRSRLDREETKKASKFGNDVYAEEELLAEFSAAFLCVECGISNADLETDAAAYIQNWLRVFKSDSRIAVFAAQRAQKVADFILNRAVISQEVAA